MEINQVQKVIVLQFKRRNVLLLGAAALFVLGAGMSLGVSKFIVWTLREDVIRAEKQAIEQEAGNAKMRALAADVGRYCQANPTPTAQAPKSANPARKAVRK